MIRRYGDPPTLSVGLCLVEWHHHRNHHVGVASDRPALQHYLPLHTRSIAARGRILKNVQAQLGPGPYHHPSVTDPWPYSAAALSDFVAVTTRQMDASELAARLLGRSTNFAANVVAPSRLQLAKDMFCCDVEQVSTGFLLKSPDLSAPAVAAFVSQGVRGPVRVILRGGDIHIPDVDEMWKAAASPLSAMIREQAARLLQHCVNMDAPDAGMCRRLLAAPPTRATVGAVAFAEFLRVGPVDDADRWKECLRIAAKPTSRPLRSPCHDRAHRDFGATQRRCCPGDTDGSKHPAMCMVSPDDHTTAPADVALANYALYKAAGLSDNDAAREAGQLPCYVGGTDWKNTARLDVMRFVDAYLRGLLASGFTLR